jgi:hypothetical protein
MLVHAAMCRAYLGDGESALALGTKAMRLHPRFPPYYTAPVGLALFVLGRDAEVLALGSQNPISIFVDIPAFLAASCALTGDVERARFYLGEFLSQLGDRITYGRLPDPGEPLRWLWHVNPFRRTQDSDRLGSDRAVYDGCAVDFASTYPRVPGTFVDQQPCARYRRQQPVLTGSEYVPLAGESAINGVVADAFTASAEAGRAADRDEADCSASLEMCNATGHRSSCALHRAELACRTLQSSRSANLERRDRLPSSGR